ncbi:MAG: hypothetical protein ABSC61_00340 [Anaerolineales bacterium]
MTTFFRLRPIIRLSISLFFLIGLFFLNLFITSKQNVTPLAYFSLLIPFVGLINDFAPEILSRLQKYVGPSDYQRSVKSSVIKFRTFLLDYFLLSLPESQARQSLPLFSQLELVCAQIPARSLGASDIDDKRRRPMVIALFLIWYREHLHPQDQDASFLYIKSIYRGLTDKGKTEFVLAYNQIAILDRKYSVVETYFSPLDDTLFEHARFHFYDRFLKDDYVEEVAKKLNYKEGQIRTFKASLSSIANSGRFNLGYLKRFISDRKLYRKLFVVVSDKNLPKAIQSYITQCPHFILNYSSIANLPVLGLSSRYDVFFFSPLSLISSPSALLDEFRSIDPLIEEHPLKIYEIDPTEALATLIDSRSDFSQTIGFFENTSINTSFMSDLTYDQIMALLERNKISLRDLLRALPPAELSPSALPSEKEFLNKLSSTYTGTGSSADIFSLIGHSREIRRRINNLKNLPVQYTSQEVSSLYNKKITLHKLKCRLVMLTIEFFDALRSLNEMMEAI